MLDTIKQLLIDLIGTDNTQVVNDILIPDYAFIIAGLIVVVFGYAIIKGVFALCKR